MIPYEKLILNKKEPELDILYVDVPFPCFV